MASPVRAPLVVLFCWLFCLTGMIQAQALDSPSALAPFKPPFGPIVITERSDFSRYENGRYIGFSFREARLDLVVTPGTAGSAMYRGEVLVFEETLRDMRAAAKLLDASVPVAFTTTAGGGIEFLEDRGYPILRGVPASPPEIVSPNDRWTAEAAVVVRPRVDAPATRVRVLVEYEYLGPTLWSGQRAQAIRARYAVRYRGGDRLGDPELAGASGGRTADIVVDSDNGASLFIREAIDETYTYADGSTVRLKGFILHFHRGSLPLDRNSLALLLRSGENSGIPGEAAQREGSPSESSGPAGTFNGAGTTGSADAARAPGVDPTPAYELASGERGLVLLLYDLRFVADGADLLDAERGRLDSIAEALKQIPERSFLVEGHAADIGRPQGQYELSRDRARRIVDELVARGLPAGRFVFRGLGADHPVASNDSEQGRARNRRVEITILD